MGNVGISDYEVTYIDDYWRESGRMVLIVEDHQIVREGMRKVVGIVFSGAQVEILEASTLMEARQIIEASKQFLDLVLLDINLPDAGGTDVVECVKAEWAALPVVVVSACEDWGVASAFLRAGALGFIPKSSNIGVMISALRLASAGGRYFPPQVLDRLAKVNAGGATIEHDVEVSLPKNPAQMTELSPRQKEVVGLMLQGRSNKEIARELGVSAGTAKNYVAAVLRAYSVSSRAKAVLAARAEGGHVI